MEIIGFMDRENDGIIRSLFKQAGLWKGFVPSAPPEVSEVLENRPAENMPFVA